jgi:hypothetical protein
MAVPALDLDAVQEEAAHYSLVVDRIDNLLNTLPAIAANEGIKARLQALKTQVEGWHTSIRAVELRLRIPED